MKGLLSKRTFRSKFFFGVNALLTKKKLKCQTCGEFNDTGNAKPFTGPESRKWRKAYEQEQKRKNSVQIAAEQRAAVIAASALVAEVAKMRASGITAVADTEDEVEVPPVPAALPTPTGWHRDPLGRHQLRYWDGSTWTSHVSDEGVAAVDPQG